MPVIATGMISLGKTLYNLVIYHWEFHSLTDNWLKQVFALQQVLPYKRLKFILHQSLVMLAATDNCLHEITLPALNRILGTNSPTKVGI